MSDTKLDSNLDNNAARAAYGIGIQLGQRLRAIHGDAPRDAALTGFIDGFDGAAPRIDVDLINAALAELEQQREAQQQADHDQYAKAGEEFLAKNRERSEVQVTSSGLQYEVVTAGSGETPNAQSTVRTHYRGTLIDGTEFDSSYSRGEPTEFPVGGVIAGWTEALQMMQVGAKWKLYIPHQLAYGPQGAGGAIGPYQALVFEIELLAIL